MLSILS
jgi:hypothetical protein